MTRKAIKIKPIDPKDSGRKGFGIKKSHTGWIPDSHGKAIGWSTKMERMAVIRQGIPYNAIEVIGQRLNRPVKSVLSMVGMPQTTYNKKKSENSLMDSRHSELLVSIVELIDYGAEVFNHEEEKFQRWLKKTNSSLGGNTPYSLMDTISGIEEIKFCLNRIEFGNFA